MAAAAQKRIHALLIASFLFGFYSIVASRLLHVQVSGAAEFSEEQRQLSARSDHRVGKSLFERGRRGTIYDTRGTILATGFQSFRLFVDPNADYKPPKSAQKLDLEDRALLLLETLDQLGIKLSASKRTDIFERVTTVEWAPDTKKSEGDSEDVASGQPTDAKRKIRSRLLLDNISPYQRRLIAEAMQKNFIHNFFFQVATDRLYPEGRLTGEIVGFVGGGDVSLDPMGQAGLEASFEQLLAGYPGRFVCEKDGRSSEFDVDGYFAEEPRDGCDIELTLDLRIQRVLADELKKVYDKFKSKDLVAVGVVLDAQTNDVLAMKNYPDYSPDEVKSAKKGQFDMNRTMIHAVQSAWEPGSTLKPFIAARYREAGIVGWDERFDTNGGTRVFRHGNATRSLRDAHHNGVLTFAEIITKSSNIGMAIVGFERFGFDRLYAAVDSYAFREQPGLCLPREAHGWYLQKKDARPLYTGVSMSFGHDIILSPMLLAAKFQVFANGGVYVPPRLVKTIYDGESSIVDERKGVRYMSQAIADDMKDVLAQVVEAGTGTILKDLPWTSAAKTGTAQVLAPIHMRGSYNSSLIAFAPAQKPRITVLVFVHGVRGGTYYGGSVAGPAVREVIDKSLRILNVPPDRPMPLETTTK